MRKMAEAFNTTVPALEDEIMQLILDGQVNARIDSHNKVRYSLYVKDKSMPPKLPQCCARSSLCES